MYKYIHIDIYIYTSYGYIYYTSDMNPPFFSASRRTLRPVVNRPGGQRVSGHETWRPLDSLEPVMSGESGWENRWEYVCICIDVYICIYDMYISV